MKIAILLSFEKDLRHIHDKKLLAGIERIINNAEAAHNLDNINNLKKLKGYKSYYRIRLGDYRVGLNIMRNDVTFVRFLHRKDIYKSFPPQ